MCGIWGYISLNDVQDITKLYKAFMNVQKRGPDRSDFQTINEFVKIYLGFHRLAIMDRSTNGDQPFRYEYKSDTEWRSIYAICNGEIYNFRELVDENKFELKSSSDCEFLPQMYNKYGFENMLKQLNGEFAICVLDIDHNTESIKLLISRDHTAVRPCFIGFNENGFGFSSVLSGLVDIVDPKSIRQLKRAEIISIELKPDMKITKFNNNLINSKIYHSIEHPVKNITLDKTLKLVHDVFVKSVICRLESDRPLGALLSGGLDSSLVVSIASKYLKKHGKKLRTFSIGIPGATDKKYAEMVAKHCGTEHTHVEFTQKEFLDALIDVIKATETFDITTIRASTGQYLISKWIRDNTDIKVLLIGDGSDELCSGYMYFHNAPNPLESHKENVRLIEDICYYDVLRADRCIAYNGLEARVPFLDIRFVDLYLSLPYEFRVPTYHDVCKRKVEKWLLRKAFDTDDNYLPAEVLWRQKEAFSDGVSSKEKSWYEIIQDNVENKYTQDDFDKYQNYIIKPITKEALFFRQQYDRLFHPEAQLTIPYYWMPKWSGNVTDPSARVLKVYNTKSV